VHHKIISRSPWYPQFDLTRLFEGFVDFRYPDIDTEDGRRKVGKLLKGG
jgi:hypothetical protein